MLKELLSHRPVQVALLLVIFIGISGIFYLNHVKTETEGDVVNPETSVGRQEIPSASTPEPATQGGHRHADGTWHAEPHEPVDVSEAEVAEPPTPPVDLTPGQKSARHTRQRRRRSTGQSPQSTQELSERMQAFSHEDHRAWRQKRKELSDEYALASQAFGDAYPKTEEEWKRYKTDEGYQREVGRKASEALAKKAKIGAMLDAHMEKEPISPTQ